MAIKNTLEDEQLLQNQNQAGGINTSGVVGSTTDVAPTASGSGIASVDAGKAPTSSGFVNLDKYLTANQGSGAGLAGAATKDLTDKATSYQDSAKNAVQNSAKDFSSASRDSEANNIKASLAGNASGVRDSAANFLGANYTGPKASDYTGQLKTDADKLNQNLNQVDDSNYQQGLLKDTFGKTQPYSAGFGQLDSFLINGSQEGRSAIQSVKDKQKDVTGAYQGAESGLTAQEQAARNALANNQASIKNTAHDQYSNLDSQFNNQVAQKNASLDYANRDGVKAYGAGDFAKEPDILNLQALASLSGDNFDAAKYAQKGGSEGSKIVITPQARGFTVPTAYQESTGDGSTLAQVGGLSPIMTAGANISDTTKQAGQDISNSVKQPSNPVIQAHPDTAVQQVAKYVTQAPAANPIVKYATPRLKKLGR